MIWHKVRSDEGRWFSVSQQKCWACHEARDFSDFLTDGMFFDDGAAVCSQCNKWRQVPSPLFLGFGKTPPLDTYGVPRLFNLRAK